MSTRPNWTDGADKKQPALPRRVFSMMNGLGDFLRRCLLNGLVGLAADICVHLDKLRCLGEPAVIGALRVRRLDLDGLLHRIRLERDRIDSLLQRELARRALGPIQGSDLAFR